MLSAAATQPFVPLDRGRFKKPSACASPAPLVLGGGADRQGAPGVGGAILPMCCSGELKMLRLESCGETGDWAQQVDGEILCVAHPPKCSWLPREQVGKWLGRSREIYNLLRLNMGSGTTVMLPLNQDALSDSLQTRYRHLSQTSRSFAAVIPALHGELRHAVCIFYLVLRALDTVEDDMIIALQTKVPMLHDFHSHLYQPDWRYMESTDKCKQLLEDFPTISLEFRNLSKVYQDVIADMCHKMGAGMAELLQRKVDSLHDWDKVTLTAGCHLLVNFAGQETGAAGFCSTGCVALLCGFSTVAKFKINDRLTWYS